MTTDKLVDKICCRNLVPTIWSLIEPSQQIAKNHVPRLPVETVLDFLLGISELIYSTVLVRFYRPKYLSFQSISCCRDILT